MNLERVERVPGHSKKRPAPAEPLAPRNYRVWAPHAERLALRVDEQDLPMRPGEGGWWTVDRPMRVGERYSYIVNGEGPFPDPRSMCQPAGVHGPSECVDHSRFPWTDDGW